MQHKKFFLTGKNSKTEKNRENRRKTANDRDRKRQNAVVPDPGAKRFFQNVDNLTFIDYYTVKEKVKEKFSFKDIEVTTAGCVVTSHCGQGTLGVLYIKK